MISLLGDTRKYGSLSEKKSMLLHTLCLKGGEESHTSTVAFYTSAGTGRSTVQVSWLEAGLSSRPSSGIDHLCL